MPLVVIYDANVLYPSTLQDLLIRVAQAPGTVSDVFTHLQRNGPHQSVAEL